MSISCRSGDENGMGNSEKDWEIFDVLCKDIEKVFICSANCGLGIGKLIELK